MVAKNFIPCVPWQILGNSWEIYLNLVDLLLEMAKLTGI